MIHHLDIAKSAPLMKRAAMAAVGVAGTLVVVKAAAWLVTGSVALLGSLVDSALDLAASSVNLIAVRAAIVPPDKEHRFGHGKAEAIAGLFQASIILGSAAFLTLESIDRIVSPTPVESPEMGVAVSLFALLATVILIIYQRRVVKRTGSIAIEADYLHYVGDVLLNLAVIAALILSTFGGMPLADGAFGLAIAAYIAFAAWGIGRRSVDMLMDREFDDAEREKIFNLVMGNPDVRGLHDLKTRRSGAHSFIQMHIEVEPDITVSEAHYISDEVEATVGESFPGAEIIIHTDPLGVEGHLMTDKELE